MYELHDQVFMWKTECYGTVGKATCYRENLCMNCMIRCLCGKPNTMGQWVMQLVIGGISV